MINTKVPNFGYVLQPTFFSANFTLVDLDGVSHIGILLLKLVTRDQAQPIWGVIRSRGRRWVRISAVHRLGR